MDENEKKELKKHALEGAAYETVQRYGEAVKEYAVAYTGEKKNKKLKKYDIKGKSPKKGLKGISKFKVNKEFDYSNKKQQAGFSAEVKSVAKENAEHIIKGDGRRVARTDDVTKQDYGESMSVGGTNDEYFDIAEVSADGEVITARQVKFVGGNPDECAEKLLGKKFDKYREEDVPIEVPKDFYDDVIKDFKKRENDLERQIERAKKDGNEALAQKHEKRLETIRKTRENLKSSNITNDEAMRARLHPKLETAKEIGKVANRAGLHQAAIGATMAGGMSIIKNVAAYLKGEKESAEAARDVAKDTGAAAAVSYATAFSGSVIKGIMQNSASDYTRALAHTGVPSMLVSTVASIGELTINFFNGAITAPQFAENLIQKGINELGAGMFNTLFMGMVGGSQNALINAVAGMAGSSIGYMAAVALYEQVKNAVVNYQMAVEKRKQVEAQCAEAVELICQYREEMNIKVERYFTEYLTTFNEGFLAMDKAIVEGDINGFVSGNVKIQELLGHEIQFRNEEEFEELMLSEESLKL